MSEVMIFVKTNAVNLIALDWFVNTVLFMILSVFVVLILYRREFKSRTLSELVVSHAHKE